MNRTLRGTLAAVAISTLTACAGMSEQACLVTDWRTVGLEDGAAGRPVTNIGSYRQACGRHGVSPDLAAYRAGHDEGVELYCRAGNGFEAGRRGRAYQGVCPADSEPEFLAAYNSGRRLYELETALAAVDRQIASNNSTQVRIKQEITDIGVTMIADDTTAEERVRLVARTAELGQRYAELSADTETLENERIDHERALRDYEETLALGF